MKKLLLILERISDINEKATLDLTPLDIWWMQHQRKTKMPQIQNTDGKHI